MKNFTIAMIISAFVAITGNSYTALDCSDPTGIMRMTRSSKQEETWYWYGNKVDYAKGILTWQGYSPISGDNFNGYFVTTAYMDFYGSTSPYLWVICHTLDTENSGDVTTMQSSIEENYISMDWAYWNNCSDASGQTRKFFFTAYNYWSIDGEAVPVTSQPHFRADFALPLAGNANVYQVKFIDSDGMETIPRYIICQ